MCLKFTDARVTGLPTEDQRAFVKRFKDLLEGEGAVFDMEPHRNAPPGLRLWCGCTVETADVRGRDAVAGLGVRGSAALILRR